MTNAERISTLEEIYSYFMGCYMNAPYGQARTKFQRFLDVVKDAERHVGTERKSGRWIPYNPDSSGRSYQFDCSICKYTVRLVEPSKTWGYLFCPYCGSIMGEES